MIKFSKCAVAWHGGAVGAGVCTIRADQCEHLRPIYRKWEKCPEKNGRGRLSVFLWSRREAQLAGMDGMRGVEWNTLLTVKRNPGACSPGWPSE